MQNRYVFMVAVGLVGVTSPLQVEAFDNGDVLCAVYNEYSESCLFISTISDVTDKSFSMTTRLALKMSDGWSMSFTENTTYLTKPNEYCLVDHFLSELLHEGTPFIEGFGQLVEAQMDNTIQEGLCGKFLPCGDNFLAAGFVGGDFSPSMSMLMTHFPANEPRIENLSLRYEAPVLGATEDRQPSACYPK